MSFLDYATFYVAMMLVAGLLHCFTARVFQIEDPFAGHPVEFFILTLLWPLSIAIDLYFFFRLATHRLASHRLASKGKTQKSRAMMIVADDMDGLVEQMKELEAQEGWDMTEAIESIRQVDWSEDSSHARTQDLPETTPPQSTSGRDDDEEFLEVSQQEATVQMEPSQST